MKKPSHVINLFARASSVKISQLLSVRKESVRSSYFSLPLLCNTSRARFHAEVFGLGCSPIFGSLEAPKTPRSTRWGTRRGAKKSPVNIIC